MRSGRLLRAAFLPVLLSAAACAPAYEGEDYSEVRGRLAKPGPWSIPASTLAIGDTQFVENTQAGPWLGPSGCSGGMTPGNDLLRDYLYAHFPQAYSIGGYSCRSINGDSSKMSVHGTGRALDIMIHTVGSAQADNDLGDPIGNFLIENAEAIGIQYIIWDLHTWNASRPAGTKAKDYGGAHPHNDHLHVELSVEASKHTTNWFEGAVSPPKILDCESIPEVGAIIEETDACFRAFGDAKYWRLVSDAGHGDSLLWTNAWENAEPGNWARWNLDFDVAGAYTVEVYIDPTWGVYQTTEYSVKHGANEALVTVDQAAKSGWVSLGDFDFAQGPEQHVSVYDNVLGAVADDQHIAVDAIRLTPVGGEPPTGGWTPGGPVGGGGNSGASSTPSQQARNSGDDGGCSVPTAPAQGGGGSALFALSALLLLRRRRD
jgi:MYXO-CTERM domain-containing protein